jgi:hypothetical protein
MNNLSNVASFIGHKVQLEKNEYVATYGNAFLRQQDISIDYIDLEEANKYQIRVADIDQDNLDLIINSFSEIDITEGTTSRVVNPIHVIERYETNARGQTQTRYVVVNGYHRVRAALNARETGMSLLDVVPAYIFNSHLTSEQIFALQVKANIESRLPQKPSTEADVIYQIQKVLDGTFKKSNFESSWHKLFGLKRFQSNEKRYQEVLEEAIYDIFGKTTLGPKEVKNIVKRISSEKVISRFKKYAKATDLTSAFEKWAQSQPNFTYDSNNDEIMVWKGTQFDYHVLGRAIRAKEVNRVGRIILLVHSTNLSDKSELDLNNYRKSALRGANDLLELPCVANDLIDEMFFAPQKRPGVQGSTLESGFWRISGKKKTGAFVDDSKQMSNGWNR